MKALHVIRHLEIYQEKAFLISLLSTSN